MMVVIMNVTSIFRTYLTKILLTFLFFTCTLNACKINPTTFNWEKEKDKEELSQQFLDNFIGIIVIAFASRESVELSNIHYEPNKGEYICNINLTSKTVSYLIKPIDETLNNFINELMKLMEIILNKQNQKTIPTLFDKETLNKLNELKNKLFEITPEKIMKSYSLTFNKTCFIYGKGQVSQTIENIYSKFEQCISELKNVIEIMNEFTSKYKQFKKISNQTQILLEQIQSIEKKIKKAKQSNNS